VITAKVVHSPATISVAVRPQVRDAAAKVVQPRPDDPKPPSLETTAIIPPTVRVIDMEDVDMANSVFENGNILIYDPMTEMFAIQQFNMGLVSNTAYDGGTF
jgi:hypothetical protein